MNASTSPRFQAAVCMSSRARISASASGLAAPFLAENSRADIVAQPIAIRSKSAEIRSLRYIDFRPPRRFRSFGARAATPFYSIPACPTRKSRNHSIAPISEPSAKFCLGSTKGLLSRSGTQGKLYPGRDNANRSLHLRDLAGSHDSVHDSHLARGPGSDGQPGLRHL